MYVEGLMGGVVSLFVCSSSIFDSLDYPNPFRSENDQIGLKPSKEEAMQFLEKFIHCLGRLVQAIQG